MVKIGNYSDFFGLAIFQRDTPRFMRVRFIVDAALLFCADFHQR